MQSFRASAAKGGRRRPVGVLKKWTNGQAFMGRLGDAAVTAGHYQTAILPHAEELFLVVSSVRYLSSQVANHAEQLSGTLEHALEGIYDMLDFVLGFAFVAMILSPAALASCFRHIARIAPEPAVAHIPARARLRARLQKMRRAG
jgi:hypothetical protein